jgi:uncharacterized protein YdeI (YjbR/CyaY-like superfamily)
MPSRRDDAEQVHAETLAQWRAWLEANHARPDGVWFVSWKPATGRPSVPYEQVVEEALCFGWIDSSGRTLDGERSALWMAPRKRGSGWARSNKERIIRLEAEGRMTDAGRALIDAAKADGSWTLLDSVEAGEVPDDLAAAFESHAGSRAIWDAFPKSVRRAHLEWIVQAKTDATRAKRIADVADKASRGERANEWVPKDQRPST